MSKATRSGIFIVVVCNLMGSGLAADGNWLLENCQVAVDEKRLVLDVVSGGLCFGYMLGVRDTLLGQLDPGSGPNAVGCVPFAAAEDSNQLVRVFVKYLENNPAELHESAAILVQRAFMDAFPCEEGEQ